MRASFAFVLALVAGCFTPDLGDGKVACGVNQLCPTHYFCHSDNYCWRAAEGGGGGGGADFGETFDFAGGDFAACVKATCDPLACGVIPDNCGSTIDCGSMCSVGKTCGGGGTPHECGCPTQVSCGARNCGTTPDGCGGVLSCGGNCPAGQTCGGGPTGTHIANVCAAGAICTPKTCQSGKDCGLISDNCSAVLDCGMCSAGKMCGSDHVCH
ncbi:MAG: hypothetical protein LC659_14695 [Myxococcales bacterium]|nr:hypothetical protein [Myxococcales bacterium]